jgi:UPF0755 protein
MRRVLLAAAILLLVIVLAGGGSFFYARSTYQAPGPLPQAKAVVIPPGGLDEVAATLARAGVIARPRVFRIAALATSGAGPLHAAELAFPAHASLRQVLAVLRSGRPVQHMLTIPEGLTAAQIAERLATAPGLMGPYVVPAEGAALPDTYAYEWGAMRAALLGRAEAAMRAALAREWAARASNLPIATPAEAVILASIVERETAKPEERPMVAAVFLNRLRRGMKLQSDPTAAYAPAGGLGPLDHPLTRADLDASNPYNTYVIDGLPPSPICAPGIAALHAVLHPAASEALYFVADGSGGHVFADTLAEHLRNVARYRALPAAPADHS